MFSRVPLPREVEARADPALIEGLMRLPSG
jgi:hypothetical protein